MVISKLHVLLCLAAAMFRVTAGAAGIDNVSVGGNPIDIPAPAGYVRCDGVSEDWDRLAAGFVSPQNRFLICFGSKEDLEALKKGEHPSLATSFNVQVAKSVEAREIGQATFGGVKAELKAGLGKPSKSAGELSKQASASIGKELNTSVDIDLSSPVFLGFFEDTDTSLGFTMTMSGSIKGEAGEQTVDPIVVAAIITPVNGRLLNFYCTMPYAANDEKARALAEKTVSEWASDTVQANPKVAGPKNESKWYRTFRSALIGGAIGGLYALGKLLWKRRSAA